MTEDNKFDLKVISFAEVKKPSYRETRGADRGYLEFGEKNDYPGYLLQVYNDAPTHGAIINGKSKYIFGKGFKETNDPRLNAFISNANSAESLNEVARKFIMDLLVFGGAYLQVIWSRLGGYVSEIYHTDYNSIRTNKSNTQFWYKETWCRGDVGYSSKPIIMPAFDPEHPYGRQMLYVKLYRPGLKGYALPDYIAGLTMAEAEIEVSNGVWENAQSGFSPSKHIFFGDQPGDEKVKATIEKKVKEKFTGSKGQKFILSFGRDAKDKPVIEDLGQSDLSKEDFTAVTDLVTSKIFIAHSVVSGVLFGVATPGSLGENTKLQDAYSIFKATYADPMQQFVCETFNRLASYRGIQSPKLELQDLSPIEIELDGSTIAGVMSREEIRERAGLAPLSAGAAPGVNAGQELSVNDNLKNMTGRQNIAMDRIIRKHTNGTLTTAQAKMMLTAGFGLSDEQANVMLGIAEFSDKDPFGLLETFGTPRADVTVYRTRHVSFESDEDMILDEQLKGPIAMEFAEKDLKEVDKQVLDLLTKDELIDNVGIAEALSMSVEEVERSIARLTSRGILKERNVTEKAKTIDTEPEISLQIMYSYEGPKDSKNRPFCAKMLELDRLYTRKEIESLSQRLGYSVFDRRGGWYTIPGTDEHRPYCRHNWKSNVVIKN